jgi:DNA-binding response OmpR family regulator
VVVVADHDAHRRAHCVELVAAELDVAPLVARNGREALSEARRVRADLLVMPIQTTGLSGLEVVMKLRQDEGHRVRVLLLGEPAPQHKMLKLDGRVRADAPPLTFRRALRSLWDAARNGRDTRD